MQDNMLAFEDYVYVSGESVYVEVYITKMNIEGTGFKSASAEVLAVANGEDVVGEVCWDKSECEYSLDLFGGSFKKDLQAVLEDCTIANEEKVDTAVENISKMVCSLAEEFLYDTFN